MAGEKLGEEKKKPGAKAQMLARFATSLSAGLAAEGQRRAKEGYSGAGFAAAFDTGITGLKDFTEKLDAATSAELDKLGFSSIDQSIKGEVAKNNSLQSALDIQLGFKAGQAMSGKDPEVDSSKLFDGKLEF
tara:strand:- start:417 stop:812 length:396 start_codon:yes stop_codon:yes gene_type:complete